MFIRAPSVFLHQHKLPVCIDCRSEYRIPGINPVTHTFYKKCEKCHRNSTDRLALTKPFRFTLPVVFPHQHRPPVCTDCGLRDRIPGTDPATGAFHRQCIACFQQRRSVTQNHDIPECIISGCHRIRMRGTNPATGRHYKTCNSQDCRELYECIQTGCHLPRGCFTSRRGSRAWCSQHG